MATDMQVAETIYNQIGRKAFFMMGAKERAGGDNFLVWKVGRNAKKVTHVCVTLADNDTYTVEFRKWVPTRVNHKTLTVTGGYVKTLAEFDGVYADQLRPVIEENTGLYLSL